jgi:hypothetical protein
MEYGHISKTIINQLGRKTMFIIGAKQLVSLGNTGVEFRVGRNAKAVNVIQIELTTMDTYSISFYKGAKKLNQECDLHADMLAGAIERNTGMYTSF